MTTTGTEPAHSAPTIGAGSADTGPAIDTGAADTAPAGPPVEVRLDDVQRAVADVAAGRPVIVVDDADRENEGDLILAADSATPELLALTIRHSSGIVCVSLRADRLERLGLPPMVQANDDPMRTAFTVTVDARSGVTTGVSATDRARTIGLLANEATAPADLTRPGHIFPLRARDGGVLTRRGHTEAAVDLADLSGRAPVGVLAELVHDDGTMMRAPALRAFADQHGLVMISIEQLAQHRLVAERPEPEVTSAEEPKTEPPWGRPWEQLPRQEYEAHKQERQTALAPRPVGAPREEEPRLELTDAVDMPTAAGPFRALAVRESATGAEHLVLIRGDVTTGEPVLTRVHSECVTGDVLHSRRCDCGAQLQESLARIDHDGRGIMILLRGHEGRGIGLFAKLRAYALQQDGRDTVEANLDLGLPIDARSFEVAPQIMRRLGVRSVRLLTHNPVKAAALREGGIEISEQIDLTPRPTPENLAYLTAKRDRLGHRLQGLGTIPEPAAPEQTTPEPAAPEQTTPEQTGTDA